MCCGRFDLLCGENEAVGGLAERVPHDLQSGEREGETDQHFGHPDGASGHQAQIARGGQQASAGEGVAVDRGDDRSRGVEQGQERLVEHRQECRDVGRATIADAAQIDAGGEDRAGAGEHDRPGVGVSAHGRGDRVAKLDVQGADLAVREPDDGDAVVVLDADHVFHTGYFIDGIGEEAFRPRALGPFTTSQPGSRLAWR